MAQSGLLNRATEKSGVDIKKENTDGNKEKSKKIIEGKNRKEADHPEGGNEEEGEGGTENREEEGGQENQQEGATH